MHELVVLLLVVVALLVATTVVATVLSPVIRIVETVLLSGAILIIVFVMFFVGAEVIMRYAFNAPIAGHLEGSELLLPVIVFLAISYTQATRGHVGMDLLLDMLAPRARRYAEMAALLISIFVCAILAYFTYKLAYQLWLYDDVTMTPPYFRTWPTAMAIPLGYGLISFRMYLQVLSLYDPERFPDIAPVGSELHAE